MGRRQNFARAERTIDVPNCAGISLADYPAVSDWAVRMRQREGVQRGLAALRHAEEVTRKPRACVGRQSHCAHQLAA
jgi:hypothetical protein